MGSNCRRSITDAIQYCHSAWIQKFRDTEQKGPLLSKKTIDLYPIQMCGKVEAKGDQPAAITTNFDTYTLILQLAAILVTVPEWKRTHSLRVILFVEQEYHRTNETQRMKKAITGSKN